MQAVEGRVRWVLGGGVAIGAIAFAAVAVVVLAGRTVPPALTYVPGDSVVVGELRADLPGDQLANLGNLLSHFPGFADQSTLATKLDQSLDQAIGGATNGTLEYTTEIEPWLAGPAYVSLALDGDGGPAASTAPGATASPAWNGAPGLAMGGDALVVTTTSGKVTCDAVVPASGSTSESYDGVTIAESSDGRIACALDGRYGLLGPAERVKAGLDAHRNGTGIDRDGTYGRARDALGGDRLVTLYVSGRGAAAMLPAASSSLGLALPASAAPAWTMAGLRAEDDALVADVVVAPGASSAATAASSAGAGSPLPSLATLPPPHASRIVGSIPGDTIVVAEAHGVGVAAQDALAEVAGDPELQAQAAQLEATLTAAGGASGLVGWVDDAALVVLPGPATGGGGGLAGLDAGIVLVAPDAATASAKADQLRSLLSLAALSAGGTTQDNQDGGTTVTTIDLGDVSALLGQADAGAASGGVSLPADLHLSVSIAAQGPLVVVGGTEAFVRSVIEVDAGQSLADQGAYQQAIGHAPAGNLGQVYAAGDGLRSLVPQLLPTQEQSRWQTDVLPYVEPVQSVLATTTIDGSLWRSRLVVSVVTPPPSPAAS